MDAKLNRLTPIALFTALTRAVREEAMPSAIRERAYSVIERLAYNIGLPEFQHHFDALRALAEEDAGLRVAIEPLLSSMQHMCLPASCIV